MPRKTKTTTVNELPVNLAEQASDNAGTVPAVEATKLAMQAEFLRIYGLLETLDKQLPTNAAKKYSPAELGTLLSIATSLLGQQPYGTHPDAVLSRAKAAFDNAEAILPLYQALADKDA
ncbi:hypothetical protein Ep4_014 [Pseudomonas phage Ep4]|uniref:Uncharacterized protein n=1 Tax=Pseudomonas phage Ep4 TaxID=3057492 RepID=A0AAU9EG22_9CAUD|nr:hypothetical protein Ep4_014 [Pseudomonas phage Ep4]